jgi:hypothetical protein
MNSKKYEKLKSKVQKKDSFEEKNESLDKSLWAFSWGGNMGSIFFAYFLVYPAFVKTITANVGDANWTTLLAGFLTVLVLSGFEIMKRKVLSNLSFDLVSHAYRITRKFAGWLLLAGGLIGASVYFSLNGAKNFASTSKKDNVVVENTVQLQIDSLNTYYANKTAPYEKDNEALRQSNVDLRAKISETPLNYRSVRKELQNLVDANLTAIDVNDQKLKELNDELGGKVATLEIELAEQKQSNEDEDNSNQILFILISASIEIIIIFGVFFREYYEFNVFKRHESELEPIRVKRERYKVLLRFLFKDGSATLGDKVMGASTLLELVKSQAPNITNPKKFVDTFLHDMNHMEILITQGNRRVINVTYDDALARFESFEDKLRLLKELK